MKGFILKRPLPIETRTAIEATTRDLLPETAELLQQGLPAISLNTHNALSTAVQNDLNPILGPAQHIVALAQPNDIVFGISTSGNAKNVALALSVAKALKLKTIGLTGKSGGMLKSLCDCCIVVPKNNTADIQERHLPIYHALCAMLEANFFAE